MAARPTGHADRRSAFLLRAIRQRVIAVASVLLAFAGTPAAAQSLSHEELSILTRSLTLLQPSLHGEGTVAIVYAADNPASYADARAIAAAIGDALRPGDAVLRPKLVDVATIDTAAFDLLIVAQGANGEAVLRTAQQHHALCVTGDVSAVRNGICILAIHADPRVEILLNYQAARSAGVTFATAFRMMVQEL